MWGTTRREWTTPIVCVFFFPFLFVGMYKQNRQGKRVAYGLFRSTNDHKQQQTASKAHKDESKSAMLAISFGLQSTDMQKVRHTCKRLRILVSECETPPINLVLGFKPCVVQRIIALL